MHSAVEHGGQPGVALEGRHVGCLRGPDLDARADQLVEGHLPDVHLAETYARAFPKLLDSDEAKLEVLLFSALWAARADNHVFDAAGEPPANLLVGDPPVPVWKSPGGTLSADQLTALRAWMADPAVKAATHWQELVEFSHSALP